MHAVTIALDAALSASSDVQLYHCIFNFQIGIIYYVGPFGIEFNIYIFTERILVLYFAYKTDSVQIQSDVKLYMI